MPARCITGAVNVADAPPHRLNAVFGVSVEAWSTGMVQFTGPTRNRFSAPVPKRQPKPVAPLGRTSPPLKSSVRLSSPAKPSMLKLLSDANGALKVGASVFGFAFSHTARFAPDFF